MTGSKGDDIEQLLAEFQSSGLRELHVRSDGFELYLSGEANATGLDGATGSIQRRDLPPSQTTTPAVRPTSAPMPVAEPPSASEPKGLPDGTIIVRAPYLGTFYRSPKPGSPPYVELGQRIDAETEICLVEVMKLFTAVRAGTAGTIHAILASDGEMVTADQPLFAIIPA